LVTNRRRRKFASNRDSVKLFMLGRYPRDWPLVLSAHSAPRRAPKKLQAAVQYGGL
jgi:hypothetical protein